MVGAFFIIILAEEPLKTNYIMKKSLVYIVFLISFSHFSYSSSISRVIVFDNDSIYEQVDVYPEFKGGMEEFVQYVQDNLKYPEEAIDKNETARVFVEFVIDKSGQVRDAQLKREEKEYFEMSAIEVISEMPKWKPGLKNGKYVNTKVIVLITFQL